MKTLKKILKILFYILIVIIAIYSTIIIVQKILWKDKTPNIFGYKNYIVLSGSMEPTLSVGDLVFVKETDNINVNDIVSFRVSNSVVTHRVIDIFEDDDVLKFITKGDANNGKDANILSYGDIEGVYQFKIPKVGSVIMFFKTPTGMFSIIVVIGLILFVCLFCQNRSSKKKDNKVEKNNEN